MEPRMYNAGLLLYIVVAYALEEPSCPQLDPNHRSFYKWNQNG
jgi:hypothetical protein